MTFTLDTSGSVSIGYKPAPFNRVLGLFWSDLSPFTQGYIEALFEDLNRRRIRATSEGLDPYGFSDLAPETLARIIADCEALITMPVAFNIYSRDQQHRFGREFWRDRQERLHGDFPPLAVQLSDDGKVRFA